MEMRSLYEMCDLAGIPKEEEKKGTSSNEVFEKEAKEAVRLIESTIEELNANVKDLVYGSGWGIFPMEVAQDSLKKALSGIEKLIKRARAKIDREKKGRSGKE